MSLTRKQSEHIRAWLCSQISVDGLPDSFWKDMHDQEIDPGDAVEYIQKRYSRIFVEMGQPNYTLWDD